MKEWVKDKDNEKHCNDLIKKILGSHAGVDVDNESKACDDEEQFRQNLHRLEDLDGFFKRLDQSAVVSDQELLVRTQEKDELNSLFKDCGLRENKDIANTFDKIDTALDKARSGAEVSEVEEIKNPLFITGVKNLIGTFLDDARDKVNFLFLTSKTFAIDSIIIGNLDLYAYRNVISSSIFEGLMNKMTRIEKLNLRGCNQLTDENISDVVKQHPTLKSLNLRWTNITDEGLEALAENCNNLTSLNLQYTKITYAVLIALAKNCKNLTSLDLGECSYITDEGLTALAPYLGNLTNLDLGKTEITDEGLEALAKNCQNLTRLNLQWSHRITDEGLEALAPYLENLTNLDLGGPKITNKGLEALVKNCKNLTCLNLQYTKITDLGLKIVVKGCPKLERLMDKEGEDCLDKIKQEGTGIALSQ